MKVYGETLIPDEIKSNAKSLADDQIDKSTYISSPQYSVGQGIIQIPITKTVYTNIKSSDSDKNSPVIIWMKEEYSGKVVQLSSDDSSGDRIPPSFRTTFDKTEFPLTINGTNYRLDQINNLPTIKLETGKPLKLQIRMYENEGTDNIQHVTLYLNQHGEKILNDLTETSITFENEKATQITDPNNLIEYAAIIHSIEGIKDVFEFELKFSKEMNTTDLLFKIWDTKRNSVNLYIPEILTVIDVSATSKNGQSDVRKSITKSESASKTPKCIGTALCLTDKIIKVEGGDTMYIKNYKIRLSLTNTPEKSQIGFSEATSFTKKLCPVGSTIIIDQDDKQKIDAYGRMVAKVTCSGKNLNAELLENGHAVILKQYCSKSEFASESWAIKFGCKI